jgi:CRISPR-associated endonuclease Csn1
VFAERWAGFSPGERERVVLDILGFQNPDALKKHGEVKLGLSTEAAEALGEVALEDGRSAHCRPVLEKLVARMEDGTQYATARKELYPERFEARPAVDRLPPALTVPALKDFKNPAVLRAMTELRKVVNAIVAKYGKPTALCIELARDLKTPRLVREKAAKGNRENQRIREEAAAELLRETGIANPRNDDIEKVRLAKECNWQCPYTGTPISWEALFGDHPQFDVEHILPRKYLDNSFANKTLCDATFNRNRKKDRLPTECFDLNSQEWHEVVERVSRFHSQARGAKLKRFQMAAEDIDDDFVARQLNDTRMATSKGQEYLGLLFGGVNDANGRKRVYGVSGLTALLRAQWDLNSILPHMPDAPKLADSGRAPLNVKSRADHRHHAIDALVVAMTSPAIVGELSAAAGQAGQRFLRSFQIAQPWANFRQEAFDAARKIVVSHRPDRRVAGPLHAETIYSKPLPAGPGETAHRVRRPVEKLNPNDFTAVPPGEQITSGVADRGVRDAIRAKWESLGGGDPARAFNSPETLPGLTTGDGRRIPIRKARVIVNDNPIPVGKGFRQRYVDSGKDTLHHTCIVAEKHRGNEKWNDYPVTRLDMHAILDSRKPNEKRGRNDYACPCPRPCQGIRNSGKRIMWLCKGDMLEMDADSADQSKGRSLYQVKGVSSGDIKVRLHQDARLDKDVSQAGDRNRFRVRSADEFRKRRARKVTISPIGEVTGNEPSAGLGRT